MLAPPLPGKYCHGVTRQTAIALITCLIHHHFVSMVMFGISYIQVEFSLCLAEDNILSCVYIIVFPLIKDIMC